MHEVPPAEDFITVATSVDDALADADAAIVRQAVAGLVGTESLLRFGVRFTAQVWPGDTLTVRTSVARIAADEDGQVAELTVSTVNAEGREVMSGYAHARLAG